MIAPAPPALAAATAVRATHDGIVIRSGADVLELETIEPNVLRVHLLVDGKSTPRTLVVDPDAHWPGARAQVDVATNPMTISTDSMIVKVARNPVRIEIDDAAGKALLREPAEGGILPHAIRFEYTDAGPFYGIENVSLPGLNVDRRQDIRNGIARSGGSIRAGQQGDGGAPLAYTRSYGLLVDSDGGEIDPSDGTIDFEHDSRPDVEFFAIVGAPKALMHAVADISGHPPMMPKWSLGFMNSQWGSTESEVDSIVDEYRARKIPLDAFILDFDWKAWGEDDYGEWRWNSTHGAGNVSPDKFPDGASGAFARELAGKGVKLVGIFKPRILLKNAAGSTDAAASYAYAHDLFFTWETPYNEYFSNRPALDIDFSKPLARSWFWQHMVPSYDAGIIGFWNDEADARGDLYFPNLQFTNMERAMYDGARSHADRRVFSLNRNFYLGAQRYAYGEWSGDLETSFDAMREQAIRMLSALDLGEPHWSMDTGGFLGHPSPENYARWMEFAAFVPIMRVHGTYGEKRQPWVYGPQAQADAKAAIELRYRLIPYLYSCEWAAHETGVGIARPLTWEFPDDDNAPWQTDEWMVGDALLVAPVFGEGQAHRSIYLPKGTWFDYSRGDRYDGGKTIVYGVDPNTWSDIPLFVREGSIIATQDVEQYVDERPITTVYLDVFPSRSQAAFDYYDDDGVTYDYEKGAYYEQDISAADFASGVRVELSAPQGTYRPALQTYQIRLHGTAARSVTIDGATSRAWSTGKDRFGAVTTVTVDARTAHTIVGLP